jgi:type III restriction enzyme
LRWGGTRRYDFVYVDEESFNRYNPKTLKDLMEGFREFKD